MSYYEVKCAYSDCSRKFGLDTKDYKIFESVIGQTAPNPFDNLIELGRFAIDKAKKIRDRYNGKETAEGRIGSEKKGKITKEKIFFKCPYCRQELTITLRQFEEIEWNKK